MPAPGNVSRRHSLGASLGLVDYSLTVLPVLASEHTRVMNHGPEDESMGFTEAPTGTQSKGQVAFRLGTAAAVAPQLTMYIEKRISAPLLNL